MNTPAHIVANLIVLDRNPSTRNSWLIVAGSFLPDLPMFYFYFVEKMIRQTQEHMIWSVSYYDPKWQNFIDFFNSLPLILLGLGLAHFKKYKGLQLFFGGMLLHVMLDFPLHHDDAHRHLFPLSDWRFKSPFSYWDPQHFGTIFLPIEIALVVVCSILLVWRYPTMKGRMAVSTLALLYLGNIAFAFLMWGS